MGSCGIGEVDSVVEGGWVAVVRGRWVAVVEGVW